MNLATAILLVVLGMIICQTIKRSPQTKWEYSGESRKKLKDDEFEPGDLL